MVPNGVDPEVWEELPISVCLELAGTDDAVAFVDEEFPADRKALNGVELSRSGENTGSVATKTPKKHCRCGKTAKLLTVSKENKNKGRHFYGCSTRTCGFFEWAPEGVETPSRKRRRLFADGITWRRFDAREGWIVVRSSLGFQPSDVRQGSVGDCWFLSALAVVAERPDLLDRVILTQTANNEGKYWFRLFLDGRWKELCVDNQLPVKGDRPCFSQPVQNQLWVPLLEKAYAKAHGSYAAIIGGEVAEAMLELTSCPTETIALCTATFDSELVWEQLVSFAASAFPMGCATAFGGSGLVGMHAYSILDVKEIEGVPPGVQTKLDQYFAPKGEKEKSSAGGRVTSEHRNDCILEQLASTVTIRVVRLRNPWGKKEWTGDWGGSSELWTPALRRRLERGAKNDGTFWMSYHDFLLRFVLIDVCKAHRNWEQKIEKDMHLGEALLLRPVESSWAYLLYVQSSLRRDHHRRYLDVSLLVLRKRGLQITAVAWVLSGAKRDNHCEIMLDALEEEDGSEDGYVVLPIGFSDRCVQRSFTLSVMSARAVGIRRADISLLKDRWQSPLLACIASQQKALRIRYDDVGGTVEVYKSLHVMFFVARNTTSQTPLTFRLLLETPGMKQECPAWDDDSKGLLVPPNSKRLLSVLTALDGSSYNTEPDLTFQVVLSSCEIANQISQISLNGNDESTTLMNIFKAVQEDENILPIELD